MNNQNQTFDANQRRVIVAAVVTAIRSPKGSDLRNHLQSIARESGQAVPTIQKFYEDVKENRILQNITGSQGATGSVQKTQEDFRQYEPAALAFWRHLDTNNQLNTITTEPDQFARRIGVEPTVVRQLFEARTQRTTTNR